MSKTKKASSAEELSRATRQILTKAETQAELDTLFEGTPKARKKARAEAEKLFIQTPGAETMAPVLTKEAVAKNVTAFFEKTAGMTVAQMRYPELMKVAKVVKKTATGDKGPVPTRAPLTGGNS
jgi:hypothetical protein